jgi:hypothetical protein
MRAYAEVSPISALIAQIEARVDHKHYARRHLRAVSPLDKL